MTPLQIETAARRKLNAENDSFWSSAEIIENYLYFCCLEFARETRCIENIYTTTSTASQSEYTKPTLAIEITRITYNGDKLQPITQREVDAMNLSVSLSTVGATQYYWVYDDVINLWRAPSATGNTIKIWTIDEPNAITSASTLQIPTRYHPILVDGVTFQMCNKEVGDPRVTQYEARWLDGLRKAVMIEKRRKRGDKFSRVKTEQELLVTNAGII